MGASRQFEYYFTKSCTNTTFKKSEHALSHTTLAKDGQTARKNLNPKEALKQISYSVNLFPKRGE